MMISAWATTHRMIGIISHRNAEATAYKYPLGQTYRRDQQSKEHERVKTSKRLSYLVIAKHRQVLIRALGSALFLRNGQGSQA